MARPTLRDYERDREQAEKYRWLRDHIGQLVIDTDGGDYVEEVYVSSSLRAVDPDSFDRAIDEARKGAERSRMSVEQTKCEHCGNTQQTVKPWKHIPICRRCKKAMATA